MDASTIPSGLWLLAALLILVLVVPALVRFIQKAAKERYFARAGMREIDKMSGADFEMFLERFFVRQGYRTVRTRLRGDYGADLIVEIDGQKVAVQAKRSATPVGVGAVQEVVASKAYYDCAATMVITNQSYTKPALALAKPNNVLMWDRERLAAELTELKRREAAEGGRALPQRAAD